MSGTLLVSRKRLHCYEEDAKVSTSKRLRPSNSTLHFSPTTSPTDPNPDPHAAAAIPVNGCEWVEFLLREMQSSSNMDDARSRVSKSMEALEKAIVNRTERDFIHAENLQKENVVLKQQAESFSRDNAILKRAVAIQHQRHKEHEERGHELQRVKQLLSQSEEQLRTLHINNYALSLQLRRAEEGTSIPGRFHPDVF